MAGRLSPSQRVRRDCARVVAAARWVRVDAEGVAACAASLDPAGLALPALDPSCHLLGRGRDTAAFMLALEAVNFGSGDFHRLRGLEGEPSGYFFVARALKRRFEASGALSAEDLASIDADACADIFGQAGHEPARELMSRFAAAWRELGRHLLEHHGGDAAALVEAAGGSSQRLVEELVALPHFRDEAVHDGRRVCLYKRAQLTAADLSLAFGGEGLGRFDDLDRLTIFADDLVPHVLRVDGVLAYAPDLGRRVDAGEPLSAGGVEEVEIRAGAVHAAELLTAELRRRGHDVCPMRVDYCLWNRGLAPAYAHGRRHRTSTVFY